MKQQRTVILSGLRSDSHTWGLAFLKLRLEERGLLVRNLGCCVAPAELAAACQDEEPSLIVLTSVNGHGEVEAVEIMVALQTAGRAPQTPVVIGGKLTTSLDSEGAAKQRLLEAGFSGVFTGSGSLAEFDAFLLEKGIVDEIAPMVEVGVV